MASTRDGLSTHPIAMVTVEPLKGGLPARTWLEKPRGREGGSAVCPGLLSRLEWALLGAADFRTGAPTAHVYICRKELSPELLVAKQKRRKLSIPFKLWPSSLA